MEAGGEGAKVSECWCAVVTTYMIDVAVSAEPRGRWR